MAKMQDLEADFSMRALVPEQLLHYVMGVSRMQPQRLDSFLLWRYEQRGVLVAYPENEQGDEAAFTSALAQAITKAASLCQQLTVQAPLRAACIPKEAQCSQDQYWCIDLPHAEPKQKLGNLLRRAKRDIVITREGAQEWTQEHSHFVIQESQRLCARPGERALSQDGASLLQAIPQYLGNAGARAICHCARTKQEQKICALAVADYSSYTTAFYLFALRSLSAPPGTADALLADILATASERGLRRCNLGLGIHPGIEFFKKKWQAQPWLPFVECTWTQPKRSFWQKLLGR